MEESQEGNELFMSGVRYTLQICSLPPPVYFLLSICSWYSSAKNGTHVQQGWPDWAYSVSKVGVSALTRIQQKELSNDENRTDIIVNHVHPGYVNTDMTSHQGTLTIEQGLKR